MIRRRFAKRKAQKLFKGQPIVDLVFQPRIRIDAESLLQQHAFEQQQGRISISTFAAGAHGVMTHQNGIDPAPVN